MEQSALFVDTHGNMAAGTSTGGIITKSMVVLGIAPVIVPEFIRITKHSLYLLLEEESFHKANGLR